MVSPTLVIAAVVALLIIIFLVRKLFKLAMIVAAVALGVWVGLKLLEAIG